MSTLIDQVPAALARVRREIVLARFIGKLAVDHGINELRSRLDPHDRDHRLDDSATAVSATAVSATVVAEGELGSPIAPIVEIETIEEIDAESLALADYDHLPSAHVVSKLAGLDPDERRAIELYERNGRGRRTILGKLEQLKAETP